MAKTPIDIDEEALIAAQRELGTTTKKDTVNQALRLVAGRRHQVAQLLHLDETVEPEDIYIGLGIGGDAFDPEIMRQARR